MHFLSSSSRPASTLVSRVSPPPLYILLHHSHSEMEEGKEMKNSAASVIARVPLTKTPSNHYREDESEEDRFNNALLELKDLRSQLHHAADYCENAFAKAEQKKRVLEGTKSYICEAIVTVVDHLGTVSSKLEQSLLANSMVVQAEQRIDCLKQRLLAGQQYTTNLEMSSMKLSVIFPQHHEHYVSPVAALAKAMPVIEGPSIFSKPTNASFNCKSELHMLGGVYQRKKQPQANNFLSFLRVSRRKTS